MLVYIDETGDHDLVNIDSEYPIFGLGALLISPENYLKMDEEVAKIKTEFFGDPDFILHASELKRPSHKKTDPRNRVMINGDIRSRFYTEFDERIIKSLDFKILACFIKKRAMNNAYYYPADPYYFSFENLLNRIIRYGDNMNTIYAEKRGPELDTELLAEYEHLSKTGIHAYSADVVAAKTTLKLINKKENVIGLQVIDLIMSCLARHGLGKKERMINNDLTHKLLDGKYACSPTVFPRK